MNAKATTGILKGTVHEFMEDRALTLGAALAYYAIFSLGPLLVIVIGIAGLVLSEDAAQQQATQQLQSVVGEQGASVVQSMMASQTRKGSLMATIIGAVVLLLGATAIFGQLKSSLNQVWHIKPKPGRGIMGLILDRLAALLMVLTIGLLLLASVVLSTAVSAFSGQIERIIALPPFVTVLLSMVVSQGRRI